MAKSSKPTRTAKASRRNGAVRPRKPRLPEPRYFEGCTFDPSKFVNRDDAMIDEMVTYLDHLDELLRDEGRWVLIKGHEIIGVYAERNEALREAIARFGSDPVLVKQIVVREPFVYMGVSSTDGVARRRHRRPGAPDPGRHTGRGRVRGRRTRGRPAFLRGPDRYGRHPLGDQSPGRRR